MLDSCSFMNILSDSFYAGDRNAKINRHSPTHAELIPVVLIEGMCRVQRRERSILLGKGDI